MLDEVDPIVLAAGAFALLVAAAFLATRISRWADWRPAGPIALIAAAPLVPRIPLLYSLSLDDVAPVLGLGLLALQLPFPRPTNDRLLRIVLVAVAFATLARIGSSVVNGGSLEGSAIMMVKAIARPVLLVGIVAYAAIAMPPALRRHFVAYFVAVVGSLEAIFGLVAFAFPLPGGAGIEAARKLTTLYGVCPGRISGTLALSPNHVGAVFVVTLAFTVGLAVLQPGWRRWAWGLAASLQLTALVLTFTRSSIIIGALLVILLLLYYRRFILLAAMGALSAVLLFGALSMGCTSPSGGHGLPADPTSLIGGRFGDSNDRLALWYAAGHMMVDNPIFGVGLGKMDATLKGDPERYGDTPFGPATSSAHNTILLAGAETGILGALGAAVINVGLALVALRAAWRGRMLHDPLLLVAGLAILGYLVQGMVNNLFEVGATSALFALTIGAFAAWHPEAEEAASSRTLTADPASFGP